MLLVNCCVFKGAIVATCGDTPNVNTVTAALALLDVSALLAAVTV